MGALKLCAIYNVWFDSIELLPYSIEQAKQVVDEVLIIYSRRSNWGQPADYEDQISSLGTLLKWEPTPAIKPAQNEIDKRNFGLNQAKNRGFTHFIMMDCDEIYEASELKRDRDSLFNSQYMNGFVHPIITYIKTPILCCPDHTLVPGIHRLLPTTHFELGNQFYPFAYDSNGDAHIDPTRRPNFKDGIMMSETVMHHFSHVRKNMEMKIHNSTARNSLLRSTIMEDYDNAAPGYFSKFYRQELHEMPNRFNISI